MTGPKSTPPQRPASPSAAARPRRVPHRLALVALALLASALLPAAVHARTGGTAISIAAQTSNKPVGQLVYTTSGKTATITGAVADGQAGTAVELQSSMFPYSTGFAALAQTATADGGSYSFTVSPTLATRYRVVLVSDPTSQSTNVTVYAVARWIIVSHGSCGGGLVCRQRFTSDAFYPAAAAKQEAAKKVYFYFGIRYGSQTTPPARLRLVGTGPQHQRRGNRYRWSFSVTFPTAQAYHYEWEMCTRDDEAHDGLGLPGRHHCGARSLSSKTIQNGWIG